MAKPRALYKIQLIKIIIKTSCPQNAQLHSNITIIIIAPFSLTQSDKLEFAAPSISAFGGMEKKKERDRIRTQGERIRIRIRKHRGMGGRAKSEHGVLKNAKPTHPPHLSGILRET